MQRKKKVYIEESSEDSLSIGLQPLLFLGFMVTLIVIVSTLLVNAHDRARQDLIESLTIEHQLRESHQKLASEMAGITQSRLLALKAKERLGLSKPKDEEVLVLK
ncbi:MAG: hypothetical protein ACYDHW_05165 [Syntrophorhabdaceae bacterium]